MKDVLVDSVHLANEKLAGKKCLNKKTAIHYIVVTWQTGFKFTVNNCKIIKKYEITGLVYICYMMQVPTELKGEGRALFAGGGI